MKMYFAVVKYSSPQQSISSDVYTMSCAQRISILANRDNVILCYTAEDLIFTAPILLLLSETTSQGLSQGHNRSGTPNLQ